MRKVKSLLFALKMLSYLILPPYRELYGKVERFCRREIERGSFKDYAHYYLAGFFRDLNRFSDAENEYLTLLDSGFLDTDVQRGLLEVLYWQGKYASAISTFRGLRYHEIEDKTIAAVLGYCYAKVERYPEAVGFLRKAIQLGQADFHVHAYFAHALNHVGDYRGAINEYHRALSFRPDSPEVREGLSLAHINAGIIFHRDGSLEEAVEAYQHAIEFRPNHYDALFDLTQMCHTLRRFEDALRYARQMIGLKPSDPTGYRAAAVALLELADAKGAIEICEQGLQACPDDESLRSCQASAYRKLG